jgi:predicted MFS family arabinose efflux permease
VRRIAVALAALSVCFGAAFIARNALGVLAPFLEEDLSVSTGQWGMLASLYAAAWAISGALVPRLAIRTNRMFILGGLLLALSVLTIASSMASTLAGLALLRFASGLVSGPILPLVQSTTGRLAPADKRGTAMGFVQGLGGSFLAAMLVPALLVHLADSGGWRLALGSSALASLMGAAAAVAVSRIRLPVESAPGPGDLHRPLPPSNSREVWVCCIIGSAMVGWLVLSVTYAPLYLVNRLNLGAADLGWILGVGGAGSLTGTLLAPALSDRFSPRNVLAIFAAVGCALPLALLLEPGSTALLAAAFFVGNLAGGSFPLFLAVIPSRGQQTTEAARRMGWVQGISEVGGAVMLPAALALRGDHLGLFSVMVMACVMTLAASVSALALEHST